MAKSSCNGKDHRDSRDRTRFGRAYGLHPFRSATPPRSKARRGHSVGAYHICTAISVAITDGSRTSHATRQGYERRPAFLTETTEKYLEVRCSEMCGS